MSENSQGSATVGRRQVLAAGGLILGVGSMQVLLPSAPAWAQAPAPGVTLEPFTDDAVIVLSGDSTAVGACPRQLALRIVNPEVELPAQTKIEVVFDGRLYAPRRAALLSSGKRTVKTTTTFTSPDETGTVVCTVTLDEALQGLRAGEDPVVLSVATANTALYPHDLVRNAKDSKVTVAATRRSAKVERGLRAGDVPRAATPRLPWGVELSGGWGRHRPASGAQFAYYYPTQLRILAIGPGDGPDATTFNVSLDPYLVKEVTVTAMLLNGKRTPGKVNLAGTTRNTSLYQTEWRLPVKLKAGDVVEIALKTTLLSPPTNLITVKHPVVTVNGTLDPAQRQTGRHTLTRLDSLWGPESG
ncbi:hypothetical protein [Dactylosporangium sp. NPDC051484]|uniref:hypothetical protein n=1 Tax=Dactylosporangium sp. NPDC051484 TaxID=3154942 RepID=UPI00344E6C4B